MAPRIVAAASLNQTPLDWDGNRARIEQAIQLALATKAQFLVLPELALTGYGCEDMFLAPHVQARAVELAIALSKQTSGLMLNIGLPFSHQGQLYNCNLICCDGRPLGLVAKKHLDGSGIHYEPRWFSQWPVGKLAHVQMGEHALPFGDVVFSLGGTKVGYEICHDAWVPERHACDLATRGVGLIANPSASHFAFGKNAVVKELVSKGSALISGVYVYANLLGCEAGRALYGGDRIIASCGDIITSGERFTFRDVELTAALVDLPTASDVAPQESSTGYGLVHAPALPAHSGTAPTHAAGAWESSRPLKIMDQEVSSLKLEEFARAVSRGLFDYLCKTRSQGFVISLSGGADSAAIACLVKLMLTFALRDLGATGICKKLSHIHGLSTALADGTAMRLLLATAYQSTGNSSMITHTAAHTVAQAVGAQFYDIDVEPFVRSYTNLIENATQHRFSWQEDDLSLQNIQSRVRSPSIWMLANLRRALLLCTGNRSEASVGYSTMDGDSSGGLSPLGGIDKSFLRRWLVWLQTIGPSETGPIPALRLVTEQAPTAELRPSAAKQTDEADLMPYDVLDCIERFAIRDRLSPLEVWRKTCGTFDGTFAQMMLGQWVMRYFKLWAASQWKRERYASSFHLDDLNLDPKTWCRFPILSGGFDSELADLKAAIES